MTELQTMPSLGTCYRSAFGLAAKDAVTKRRRPADVLAEPVVVRGHRITAESLDAYRRLLGAGEPESVPSVLVHIEAFPAAMHLMADEAFPLPLMGMVHLTNTVLHHRPVPVDTPLDITARASELVPHHAGTAVDMTVTVADPETGEVLWEGVSRYLAKGVHRGERPERPAREEFSAPRMTGQWRLGGGAGRQYAAVSGDYNPIHLSGPSAKLLGMKGSIAHGMYLAAKMLAGREPAAGGFRWEVSFDAPVLLPATVSVAYAHPTADVTEVTGWNARKMRRHFTGTIAPIGA